MEPNFLHLLTGGFITSKLQKIRSFKKPASLKKEEDLLEMPKTTFTIPEEGVRRFLVEYAIPGQTSHEAMKHDGLQVTTGPGGNQSRYDLLTEEPVAPLVKSFGAEMVRQYPNIDDYLGAFSLAGCRLTLYEPAYNGGTPRNETLTAGFRRLAELFGVDIDLK